MKAMIFAAGKGTRLGEITQTTPKALVDICGKTILHRAVEKCSSVGFDDIIINVHYFADKVEAEIERLRRLGYKIAVSDEREALLENGGGLHNAKWFFKNEPFLLYNVDIVSDFDLHALYSLHKEKGGLATLAVRRRPGKRFLLIDNDGRLCGWRNTETGEEILTTPSSQGLDEVGFSSMHIVEPEIFKYLYEGVYSIVDIYLSLAREHNIFTSKDDDGYWVDIGTPESLERARSIFSSGK